MNTKQLICPSCGKVFTVDEADYASIMNQVKNAEFDKELARREEELKSRIVAEHKAQVLVANRNHEKELCDKELALSQKDAVIEGLKSRIKGYEETKRAELEAERAMKEREIAELRTQLDMSKNEVRLAVLKAREEAREQLQKKELEIAGLRNDVAQVGNKALIKLNSVKENYEIQLKQKDELVKYYKDMKARLSTKMIGESLEAHCSYEFNRIRTTAFPDAYFEKDNDAKSGSKGDFIFRNYAEGIEFVSIMFEMKNEADETGARHKNEDFFAKLDKDRREKGCEYAVLVSMLERESELYNEGIVDVSYRYPKMFVVRPQFFLKIIALLSTASRKTVALRKELTLAQQQSVDITNFENKLGAFRNSFSKHYEAARGRFDKAIEEIDKSIKHLQEVKAALMSSENQLRLANQDTEGLTIRKLTYMNPTMRQKFGEARLQSQAEGDAEQRHD